MGGLTFEKLLVIGIIAVFIFGPDRLPQLAEGAARLVKRARYWVDDTKQRVSDEMGADFTEDDWRKLDPRQYDPRRIVRDAWNDAGSERAEAVAPKPPQRQTAAAFVPGAAPFDSEAT